MVAETIEGCYISADTTVSCGRTDETGEVDEEKQERKPAEDTGVEIASWLLQEIEKGGVVDSTHQVRFLMINIINTKIDRLQSKDF